MDDVQPTNKLSLNLFFGLGVIRLKKKLDYEILKTYRFTVKAFISSTFSSYAAVVINVINVNDNCPSFTASVINRVYNGSPGLGSIVAIIKATDVDGSPISYNITGNTDGLFAIDNGVVTFEKPLPNSFTKLFSLEIGASDSVCFVTTVLNINVTTCPHPEEYQFKQTKYIFNVKENSRHGEIGNIAIKSTLHVKFSIIGSVPFSVDTNSGKIFSEFY